jgi:hypothetical protein
VLEDQYVPAVAVVEVPVFAYVAADVGGPQGLAVVMQNGGDFVDIILLQISS